MSSVAAWLGTYREAEGHERWGPLRASAWATLAVLAGAATAFLVANGLWFLVVAMLLVVPAFVVIHRYPMAAIAAWIIVAPLVTETANSGVRAVHTLVHRSLPIATLAVIVVSSVIGLRPRRLPKLGWPEALMGGYVVATFLSIGYGPLQAPETIITLVDRVVLPMCLYLIVRLLEPDERQLRRLLPAVVFLLLAQSAIGVLMWTVPGVLPPVWLVHAGYRTTGSFADPNTFGATMVFCGMVALGAGLAVRRGALGRTSWLLLFLLAMVMVFISFGRASWVAGLFALAATAVIYRGAMKWVAAIVVPTLLAVLASGALSQQLQFAEERLTSDQAAEEALSRLPAVYAAVALFEIRPVTGWGYENFDEVSRPFQRNFGSVAFYEKSRASHNLFLTVLAEQGLIGFALFLGPTIVLLARTKRAMPRMLAEGLAGRRFLASLWIAVAGFFIVNNLAVMHVTFGLGLWWLTLGLVASLVHRYQPVSSPLGRLFPTRRRKVEIDGA